MHRKDDWSRLTIYNRITYGAYAWPAHPAGFGQGGDLQRNHCLAEHGGRQLSFLAAPKLEEGKLDNVVCIRDDWEFWGAKPDYPCPKHGQICTVDLVHEPAGIKYYVLSEFPPDKDRYFYFRCDYFKPCQKKVDITRLQAIAKFEDLKARLKILKKGIMA